MTHGHLSLAWQLAFTTVNNSGHDANAVPAQTAQTAQTAVCLEMPRSRLYVWLGKTPVGIWLAAGVQFMAPNCGNDLLTLWVTMLRS